MTNSEKNIQLTPTNPAKPEEYSPGSFISDEGFFIGDPESPMGKYFSECRELIRQGRSIPESMQHPSE